MVKNNISSVISEIDVDVGSYQMQPKTFEEFRKEFEKLQGTKRGSASGEVVERVKGVPSQVYLQYLTFDRRLMNQNHALLTQQYELAKIEEANEDLAFQVIDKARIPIRPSSPNLILNVAIGLMGGFFIAVFIAFFLEYIEKLKAKEAHS